MTFDDNTVVAKVLNLLTEFVTTILHPVIEGIIQQIIVLVTNEVIGNLNDAINAFLHPNQTQIEPLW